PSLDALLAARALSDVVGVVTQPDKPKGRGQETSFSPIKQLALRAGVPIVQPLKMKDPTFLETLTSWKPDLICVTAFGRILPPVVLEMPPRGCINVHGSLLPAYRGAAPIQWAVINGERETGITTMLMDAGMDTGPMLLSERVTIGPNETSGELAARLAPIGGRLLVETIRQWIGGTLRPTKQDDGKATMAPMLKKEDGLLDWSQSAIALANRVRGLSPWPGAYVEFGGTRLNIWRTAAETVTRPSAPGTVLAAEKTGILVATGDGALRLLEVQAPGSRRMAARDYLAGHPIKMGTRLTA
ncbi:MAG TPA: methionyl-tRNA formyltransferase, partial [Nitrospirales bacterium]|nr:methionyl-tRNA formyltransferase [Nitrospirales bacterium]